MKKLKLNLDDLKVESFATTPEAPDRAGTVHAYDDPTPTCIDTCGTGCTCDTCTMCYTCATNCTCETVVCGTCDTDCGTCDTCPPCHQTEFATHLCGTCGTPCM